MAPPTRRGKAKSRSTAASSVTISPRSRNCCLDLVRTPVIGDVNQGMEGMQARFGELRVSVTASAKATILGQGLGMALRGLRPVAEHPIDYLLYCIQGISDDLATAMAHQGRAVKALPTTPRGHR